MICRDAHHDGRLQDNPLVAGPPGIRFYAGVPVIGLNGHAPGTLCVIDYVPRDPTPRSIRALSRFAAAVTARLHVLQIVVDGCSSMTER